ncbi:MAG: hypothetical protein V4751_02585 [Pseudomonadota bacterium]
MRWGFVKSGEHIARIIVYRQSMNRSLSISLQESLVRSVSLRRQ